MVVIILIFEIFLIGCCFFLNLLFVIYFGLIDILFNLDFSLDVFFKLDILFFFFIIYFEIKKKRLEILNVFCLFLGKNG